MTEGVFDDLIGQYAFMPRLRESQQAGLTAPGGAVLNPRRSLTEIATQLGFSEPSAFSRWFRGQFGCSPREWRSR